MKSDGVHMVRRVLKNSKMRRLFFILTSYLVPLYTNLFTGVDNFYPFKEPHKLCFFTIY